MTMGGEGRGGLRVATEQVAIDQVAIDQRVETSVAHRLGDAVGLDFMLLVEIADRSGHQQHLAGAAGAETPQPDGVLPEIHSG